MPNPTIDFAPDTPSRAIGLQQWIRAERHLHSHNLATHMAKLRRRARGASRWMCLAIVFGTITALAVVSFFAH